MCRKYAIVVIALSAVLAGCGDPIITGSGRSADQGSATAGTASTNGLPSAERADPPAASASTGNPATPSQPPAQVPAPNPTSSIPIPGNRPDPGPSSTRIDPPSTKPE